MKGYSEKLRDPRWQKRRLEVLQEANFACSECESKDKPLHVHHCYYLGGNPWERGESDGSIFKVLCEDCHLERQHVEQVVKLEFARLLSLLGKDDLVNLVTQILTAKKSSENGIRIVDDMTWEYFTDDRWLQYAYANPEFRKCFTEITGRTVKTGVAQ